MSNGENNDAWSLQRRLAAVEARVKELETILRRHHEWHQDLGTVGLTRDDEGAWIEVDMSDAYSDSSLCDATVNALAAADATPAAPVPEEVPYDEYRAEYDKNGKLYGAFCTDPIGFDKVNLEDAIIDALAQGSVRAWPGDGVGCVANMIYAALASAGVPDEAILRCTVRDAATVLAGIVKACSSDPNCAIPTDWYDAARRFIYDADKAGILAAAPTPGEGDG